MTRKYHAIPVLMYVPVDVYPDVADAHNQISGLMNAEEGEFFTFFAEDFQDGIMEIDHDVDQFSAMITVDCERSHVDII
jgi:hypothetical protein